MLPPVATDGSLPRAFFSLLVQRKVTIKKAPPWAACPALRSGFAIEPGIFGRGLLPLPKTAHVLCAALRVLPGPLATPERGPRKAKARTAPTAAAALSRLAPLLLLLPLSPLLGPFRSGGDGGQTRRAPHRTCGVLGRHRRCRPKIPAGDTDPSRAAAGARRPGCAFFGYFLCTSKEVLLNSRMAGQVTPRGERAFCDGRQQLRASAPRKSANQ